MILPQNAVTALLVLIVSLVCLGSWANTYKLAGKWRYELYYFDWAIGGLVVVLILALTFGSLGYDGFSFRDDISIAAKKAWLYSLIAGAIFNLGNLLLVATMSIGGMAVAFPICLGVALIESTIIRYAIRQPMPLTFVIMGGAMLIGAAVAAALIHRSFILMKHEEVARAGKAKSTRRPFTGKAAILAVVSGLILGSFEPLLDRARAGETGLGPYSIAFLFVVGTTLSTLLFDLFLMNLPVEGEPLEILDFFHSEPREHLLGLLGGAIWGAGLVAALVAAALPEQAHPNPGTANALSQSAVLLAAFWGMFVWKEFRAGDGKVKLFGRLMLLLLAGGIAVLSVGPAYVIK